MPDSHNEPTLSKRDYLSVQIAYANPNTISRDHVETFWQQILAEQGLQDYAIVTVQPTPTFGSVNHRPCAWTI